METEHKDGKPFVLNHTAALSTQDILKSLRQAFFVDANQAEARCIQFRIPNNRTSMAFEAEQTFSDTIIFQDVHK